ncbi:hypothetical protein I4U23_010841 [Adineta vaga]|nr:hypothetical protein I4U23_010841 [Adineta vaga]
MRYCTPKWGTDGSPAITLYLTSARKISIISMTTTATQISTVFSTTNNIKNSTIITTISTVTSTTTGTTTTATISNICTGGSSYTT